MRFIHTITIITEIPDLSDYQEDTIQEAAAREQQWYDEGDLDIMDLVGRSDNLTHTITGEE